MSRGFFIGGHVTAAQLVVLKEGRVLLIRPTYRPNWEFPGGLVEEGETAEEAARREAFEEAFIHTDGDLQQLSVLEENAYGTRVTIHIFRALDWTEVSTWKPGFEIGAREFFSPTNLPEHTSLTVRDVLQKIA